MLWRPQAGSTHVVDPSNPQASPELAPLLMDDTKAIKKHLGSHVGRPYWLKRACDLCEFALRSASRFRSASARKRIIKWY